MAKMTAEQRRHLITKTAVSYRAYVLTIDTTTGKNTYEPYTISGTFDTDISILSAIAGRYTTREKAVAPMSDRPIEKIEKRFAMTDSAFVRYGRMVTDDTKTVGYMVRTITMTEVTVRFADFETETFGTENIVVCGDFVDAESAVDYYKRYENISTDSKVYGPAKITEKTDIKFMIRPEEFFANSFAMNDEEQEEG